MVYGPPNNAAENPVLLEKILGLTYVCYAH